MQNYRSNRNREGGGDFKEIISLHNLFLAWDEFKRGKKNKQDVQEFSLNLEDNIFRLHNELLENKWIPDPYIAFYVRDPKLRHIHKASIRDRVLYQAVYRQLYKVFDKHFIHDSYACRNNKGLHKGVKRLEVFLRKSTKNYKDKSYALKCDIKKFFDSIRHDIMLEIISRKITDPDIIDLVDKILKSFSKTEGIGLPLGNVTSQLFANVYLNELDQFIKHKLKAGIYIRYCDDFVIVDPNKNKLVQFISQIDYFLQQNLDLKMHPNKIIIRKVSYGVDFLGYVLQPHYRTLRTKTKKRFIKKIERLIKKNDKEKIEKIIPSYFGTMFHCHGNNIRDEICKILLPHYPEIDAILVLAKTLLKS